MSEVIFIVEDSDEGGYTAKSLGHSIHTEGDTTAQQMLCEKHIPYP